MGILLIVVLVLGAVVLWLGILGSRHTGDDEHASDSTVSRHSPEQIAQARRFLDSLPITPESLNHFGHTGGGWTEQMSSSRAAEYLLDFKGAIEGPDSRGCLEASYHVGQWRKHCSVWRATDDTFIGHDNSMEDSW